MNNCPNSNKFGRKIENNITKLSTSIYHNDTEPLLPRRHYVSNGFHIDFPYGYQFQNADLENPNAENSPMNNLKKIRQTIHTLTHSLPYEIVGNTEYNNYYNPLRILNSDKLEGIRHKISEAISKQLLKHSPGPYYLHDRLEEFPEKIDNIGRDLENPKINITILSRNNPLALTTELLKHFHDKLVENHKEVNRGYPSEAFVLQNFRHHIIDKIKDDEIKNFYNITMNNLRKIPKVNATERNRRVLEVPGHFTYLGSMSSATGGIH